MFTGIIPQKKRVLATSEKLGLKKVSVERDNTKSAIIGQSISIDGVCSTILEVDENHLVVEYMPETLKKTTMKDLIAGNFVNAEFSLKAGDPIDGHFIYGHVDCVGIIDKIKQEEGSKVFSISIPKEFHKYIAYKGSVAVDGVSLTISGVNKSGFEVSLIPYTLEHTTLGEKKTGEAVNIETDVISKYLERIQSLKGKDQS